MSEPAPQTAPSGDACCRTVDARGLKCPLPVLHTRRVLRQMAAGELLEVFCTDPVSAIDIPNLVREEGCSLAASETLSGVYRFVIVAGEKP